MEAASVSFTASAIRAYRSWPIRRRVNQALEKSRAQMKEELEKISGGVKIPGLT